MIIPRKEIYQRDKKEEKKKTYILVSIKTPPKLVYYRERDKNGMILRYELDFNDPITALAAKQNGIEFQDCIFKYLYIGRRKNFLKKYQKLQI